MPARKVGDAHVADLSRAYQRVQRRKHFLRRSSRVEAMQLEQVDVVRSKAFQGLFYGLYEVIARRANLIESRATTESSFGRDDEAITRAPLDCTTEQLFRIAGGVDVG